MEHNVRAEGAEATQAERVNRPVCVIDNDAGMAANLAGELRLHGFRTRHFTSLDLLINFLATGQAAALLIDATTLDDPTYPAVRDRLVATRTPIMVMDESDSMDHRLRAVSAGGTDFLQRPFSLAVLAHLLRSRLTVSSRPEGTTVLLIDTSGTLVQCAAMLQEAGQALHAVTDADAALQYLKSQRPGLLLVDGDSTHPTAGELLLALRQYPGAYGIPALVLTKGDKRRFDDLASAAGIEGVVGLPVASRDLLGIVGARMRRAASLQESWRYLARRDPVTGLASEGHFREELRQAVAIAREGAQRATLLHLEGHSGQEVSNRTMTLAVARVLQRHIPPPGLCAALSENAFAAIIYSRDETTLESIKRELVADLAAARPLAGRPCPPIDARIGTTLLGQGIGSVADALARARESARIATGTADEVVQTARASADDSPAALDPAWQAELTSAVAEGRFRLVYQPIASLTGQPTALYEVFVRMLDAEQNDILPQEFLPAAKRLGFARHIDRWVVGRAMEVLQEQRHRREQPVLFIKLFPETVETPSFVAWLADRLRRMDVDPKRLVFQLTQRSAARQLTEARSLIKALRELGCGLALEHYRMDGESEPLLGKLEADYVKLSAELSRGIMQDRALQQEVQSITGEARAHGARPIAALVQDAASLSSLWAAGVEYIQGYFMQEPVDVFGAEELQEHE